MREVLDRLDKIVGLLEILAGKRGDPTHNPVLPEIPSFGSQFCPKCGMDFSVTMGYVCGAINCPMGAGPVS